MNEHQATIMLSQTGFLIGMVWYRCSCGKSGCAWKGRKQAMAEHRRHVERESAIDRDCRLRDASPAVLAALKRILADLDRAMPMDCPVDPETFAQAEAAIAQAEGS